MQGHTSCIWDFIAMLSDHRWTDNVPDQEKSTHQGKMIYDQSYLITRKQKFCTMILSAAQILTVSVMRNHAFGMVTKFWIKSGLPWNTYAYRKWPNKSICTFLSFWHKLNLIIGLQYNYFNSSTMHVLISILRIRKLRLRELTEPTQITVSRIP